MMEIKDIEKLASLSRLALSDAEKETMRKEFDSILEYIAAIQEVSATSSEKTRSIIATVNVMREDNSPASGPHESGIYTEALVGAAPRREGNYIRVKKIL